VWRGGGRGVLKKRTAARERKALFAQGKEGAKPGGNGGAERWLNELKGVGPRKSWIRGKSHRRGWASQSGRIGEKKPRPGGKVKTNSVKRKK